MAEFASKGVAGTGLGLGIAGTALGVLNGGLSMLSGVGNNCNADCGEYRPINRFELSQSELISQQAGEIALLKSERYTDERLVEVYKDLNSQISALKDAQQAVNMQQAVLNGTTGATIGYIQAQVAQLMSLTKVVVPNSSVCPGWGNVTITPATTTTTTTPAA